jgi:hypothetical protein
MKKELNKAALQTIILLCRKREAGDIQKKLKARKEKRLAKEKSPEAVGAAKGSEEKE